MVKEKYWLRRTKNGGGEILVDEIKMVEEKYWWREQNGEGEILVEEKY